MSEGIAPALLIAVPQLVDPNFHQTVVLLLQQNEAGAMGVIVNRESSLLLKDLCKEQKIDYKGVLGKHVRLGGPVQPQQGLVLYGKEHFDPHGQIVVEGLHVSASTETLKRLCDLPEGRFHCYAGYAGWGPAQLEREIKEGSWIIGPAKAADVLDRDLDEMWSGVLADLGIDPALIVPGGSEEA